MEVDVVSLASEFPNDNPALHRGVIWVCRECTGPAQPERAPVEQSTRGSVEAVSPEEVERDDDVEAASAEAERDDDVEAVSAEAERDDDVVHAIVVEELEPFEANVEGDLTAGATPPAAPASGVVLSAASNGVDDAAVGLLALANDVVERRTPIFEEVASNDVGQRDSTALPPAPDDPFTVLVCTLADVAIGAGASHVASLLPGLLFDGRVPDVIDPDVGEALRAAGIWDGTQVAPSFVAVTCAWSAILRGTSDDFTACGASTLDEWASELLAGLLSAPAKVSSLRRELRGRGVAAFGLAA